MKNIAYLITICLVVLNSCSPKTGFLENPYQTQKTETLPKCSFTEFETQKNGYVKMNLKGNVKSITESVLSPTRKSENEKYSFKEDSIYYIFNREGFIIEEKKGISFVDSLDRYIFNYWIHYYDKNGNLIKISNVDTGEEGEWLYSYDSTGQKTTKTGVDYKNTLGYWTYSYMSQTRVDSFFDQTNTLLTTVQFNYKNDVLIKKIGKCYDSIKRTVTTEYLYDSLHNKIEEYTFHNDSIWDKTTYEYDDQNRQVKFTNHSVFLDNSSFSPPGLLRKSYGFKIQTYDNNDNPIFTDIYIGMFDLVHKWRTEYIYDNKGNWIKAYNYGPDSKTPYEVINRTIKYFE